MERTEIRIWRDLEARHKEAVKRKEARIDFYTQLIKAWESQEARAKSGD